jgi:quinol monooxygenase YgiN
MTNSENIVLIARLKVKKDSVEQAKQAALAIVEDSRAEKGCLNYDFHQAIDDETVFIWHETKRLTRTANRIISMISVDR